MDIELPLGKISELLFYSGNGINTINFLDCRFKLATIQGRLYKNFYSFQATRQSKAQQKARAHCLNDALTSWRSGFPIDFDEAITSLQGPITQEILHDYFTSDLRQLSDNCPPAFAAIDSEDYAKPS